MMTGGAPILGNLHMLNRRHVDKPWHSGIPHASTVEMIHHDPSLFALVMLTNRAREVEPLNRPFFFQHRLIDGLPWILVAWHTQWGCCMVQMFQATNVVLVKINFKTTKTIWNHEFVHMENFPLNLWNQSFRQEILWISGAITIRKPGSQWPLAVSLSAPQLVSRVEDDLHSWVNSTSIN